MWAGNSYLAGEALRFNSHVTVLPTSIEIERYRPMLDKPGNATVLVWIGSRSTRKYLVEVLPALEAACSSQCLDREESVSLYRPDLEDPAYFLSPNEKG